MRGAAWSCLLSLALMACGQSASPGSEGPTDLVAGDPDVTEPAGVDVPEVADHDVQVAEVEPEPEPTIPPGLGGRFLDLTAGVAWPPFEVHPGDVEAGREPDMTFGVFGDLDSDGLIEVVVSGHVGAAVHRKVYRYDPVAGGLSVSSFDPLEEGAVVMLDDLDGDGYEDALMATTTGPIIRWGDETGSYADLSVLASGLSVAYEHAEFHLTDLDGDGWVDMVVSTICGMVPMFRTAKRWWSHRTSAFQGFDTVDPYAILVWPRADRPSPVIALGNPDCGFYSGLEVVAADDEGYPLFEPVEIFDARNTMSNDEGLTGLSAMAPMGGAIADLDRDGALDLVTTFDPMHAILDGAAPWPVESSQPDSGLFLMPSDSEYAQLGWGVALLDVDRDGLDDVIVAHGDDTSRFLGTDPSPGPQWATIHLNLGDFRFLDATEHLGMGLRGGWRAVTVGDLEGDADPDLIVGGVGEAPRIYRNDVSTPHHGLALRLRGTTSNHMGIGASIVVTPAGTDATQLYVMGGMASPKAVSDPVVYAGLGSATAAEVTVSWPSGVVQTVENLAADEIHVIDEPEFLTITPAGRHLPAGGEEVATLTVRPQGEASSVSVLITHGDGIPGEAVEVEPGVWVVEIAPPPVAGSARLEVRVDGQPLAIRPRLWWDAP